MKTSAIVLLLTLLGTFGCSRGDDIPAYGERLEVTATANERRIAELNAAPVTGSTGKQENFPSPTWVAGRVDVAECGKCHSPGTVAKQPRTKPEDRASHWEVEIRHAEGMTCRTCHDSSDPASVKALTGLVTFDEAYLACGSCHKEVLKDWRGSAHGKRLTGWAEPRVIQNCAGCHNPHSPALEKRLPVAHPKIVPERLRKDAPPRLPHDVSHTDAEWE